MGEPFDPFAAARDGVRMNRQQRRAAASQGVTTPGSSAAKLSALLATAVARHQAGEFGEAESLYRQILALDPGHPDANHYLGVIATRFGRSDIAVKLIAKALARNSQDPTLHSNLGNALKDLGRLDEAVACYRRALALKPDFADAHGNLGNALADQGRQDEAIQSYERAIALKPSFTEAHNNLGNVLRDLGRLKEAGAAYRRALALKPDFADAHNNFGNVLMDQAALEEAAASYRRALDLRPDLATAHYNLGNILRDLDRRGEAIEAYKKAIALKADYFQAHNNLGATLKDLGRLEEAIGAYRQALAAKPDYVEAHNNLGNALKDEGKLDEAAAAYAQALALDPENAATRNNFGATLKAQGRLDEASEAYSQALALKPVFAEAHNNLGNVFKEQGRLEEAIQSYERALAVKPDFSEAHSNLLMSQHYLGRFSPGELLASAQRFGARFEGAAPQRIFANDRAPSRRLRIGYVSGDFRLHPGGFLLARVLESHDRGQVETFCYANQARADDMTRRLQASADHWRPILHLGDGEAAELVLSDGVDILVDLSGHTAKNRLPLFALRPAPVQMSWLGYFGTTGLGAMDYLVMDEAAAPRGETPWHSEALVRLPHGRFCYAPPDYAPAPVEPPALKRGGVTFGSFNNIAKIGRDVVALWADVLKATPNSRLLLKWQSLENESARRRLIEAFEAAGVSGERLALRGFSPHAQMLAEYGEVDIALDPFPFGGGLTSCEALWMGVPVVTLPGDRPASRQTIGFLRHVGLDECIAGSPADYAARATALAADVERLAALRRALRPRMAASPLCDGAVFTPTLEAAFRRMWQRWSAGQAPAPFDIAAA
jgi:predicted O-linked N-acetylglucosamine transferase (SPINDLY family)